jgi:hypothetical protein
MFYDRRMIMSTNNKTLIIAAVGIVIAAGGGYLIYKNWGMVKNKIRIQTPREEVQQAGDEFRELVGAENRPLRLRDIQQQRATQLRTRPSQVSAPQQTGASSIGDIQGQIAILNGMQDGIVAQMSGYMKPGGGQSMQERQKELERVAESDPLKAEKEQLAQSIAQQLASLSKDEILEALQPSFEKMSGLLRQDKSSIAAMISVSLISEELGKIAQTSDNPNLANMDEWMGQAMMGAMFGDDADAMLRMMQQAQQGGAE